MKRIIAAALVVALALAAGAQAQGLGGGGRNPRHGGFKKGTTLVGKLKGPAFNVRNVGGGPAFTFMTTGLLGGTITVGRGGDGAVPFTTNATGVAKGLNADRLDGHNASDFVLASSASNFLTSGAAIDATTLQGKHAADFLGVGGKAANSNLLDGLDSTAFLGVNATAANSSQLGGHPASFFLPATGTAADSSQLGGQPPSHYLAATDTAADSNQLGGHAPAFYEPSANHLSLNAHPFMDSGDPTATVGSGAGWTLKAACSGTTQIDLTLQNTGTDTAYLGWSGLGANEQYAVAASGSQNVFSHGTGDLLTSGFVSPLSVSIVRDDGTAFQGVLTVGIGIGGHDCFVSGSLSS